MMDAVAPTFEQFLLGIKRDPNLREGQQFMNEIFKERSDIYWLLLSEGADCFYDTSLLERAKEIASKHWNS